jgi:hypothetical protein
MFNVFDPNVSPEVREEYLNNLSKYSFAGSTPSSAQQSTSPVQPSATLSQSLAMRPYTEPEFTWIVSLIKGSDAERVVEFLNERNIPAGLCAGYPAVRDQEELNLANIALKDR